MSEYSGEAAKTAIETVRVGRVIKGGIESNINAEVSLQGWLALDYLNLQEAMVPLTELRPILGSPANVTEITTNLCLDGLAYKVENPANRKFKQIGITPTGKEVWESTSLEIDEASTALLTRISSAGIKRMGEIASEVLDVNDVQPWTPPGA